MDSYYEDEYTDEEVEAYPVTQSMTKTRSTPYLSEIQSRNKRSQKTVELTRTEQYGEFQAYEEDDVEMNEPETDSEEETVIIPQTSQTTQKVKPIDKSIQEIGRASCRERV